MVRFYDAGLSTDGNLGAGLPEQADIRGLKEPIGVIEEMLDRGVAFENVSSRCLGIESLSDKFNPEACQCRQAVMPELYDLLEGAREDQQLVIQGSPIGRDTDAFGRAVSRLGRLAQIHRSLARHA